LILFVIVIAIVQEILEWLQDINEVKQYVLEALHLTRPNPSHSNVKDQFGFRQSVVVITKANVAAAFNTETGRTMWSTYLGGEVSEMKRIFLVRKSVTRTPECTILATSEKVRVIT
jgi:predicted oxidoreductase